MGAHKLRRVLVSARFQKLSRADQGCDVAGQGGWRIAPGFFPALLRGGRALADEVAASQLDGHKWIEVGEGIRLPQAPRQNNRKGHLVELHTHPVRVAVNPKILIEATILPLSDCQIDEST